jgi:protocatechuate 3,4-dioxygenase alpha subunit
VAATPRISKTVREEKSMPLSYLKETASQTAGPYVHIGLIPHMAGFDIFEKTFGNVLVGPATKGERILVEGRVFDGSGTPLRDVLLEIWQADADGRYNNPEGRNGEPLDETFRGFGRAGSDFDSGLFRFETIKPGAVTNPNGQRIGLNTRIYFSDEAAANAADPVLNLIELPVRRSTLVAERSERDGKTVYTFNVYLQGEKETVFFDV